MSSDKLWKPIERTCVVAGLLFAAATLYYTAAGYYGWNQPLPSKPPGTSMNAPWWLYVFVAIGIALLITAWVMIFIRRRKKTEIVSSIPDYDYSDDPEAEATDKQAYKEILAFALDRVIPACETQADLQDELISRVCDNAVIAHLANVGVRQSDKTSEFWRHYTELTAGLLASPGPIIRFETIIEHIAALENESYRVLSEQRDLLAISFGVNLATDTNLRPVWLKWAQAHNALIDAYEAIKRDPRFGKLLRPARSSRWGDRIQIHLWARERGQIVTIETSEQTIDILFEPHPPYETSEISHGRGLSTVRIGLKAIGKTFANCKVYIEKIAPQPPLPGGLPIQLSAMHQCYGQTILKL